jgi:hypothetical protein
MVIFHTYTGRNKRKFWLHVFRDGGTTYAHQNHVPHDEQEGLVASLSMKALPQNHHIVDLSQTDSMIRSAIQSAHDITC